MITSDKDTKVLIHDATRRGWTVTVTRGGRLMWTAPNGRRITTARTLYWRAQRNHVALMRRVAALPR